MLELYRLRNRYLTSAHRIVYDFLDKLVIRTSKTMRHRSNVMQRYSISIAFAVQRGCDVLEAIAYTPRGQFESSFSFSVNGVAGLAREWRKHASRSSMTNGISHEPISFRLPFASSSNRERSSLFRCRCRSLTGSKILLATETGVSSLPLRNY